MKKLISVLALLLCVSVAVITVSGCAKKKAEKATEQVAPTDTTQVDTTATDTTAVK